MKYFDFWEKEFRKMTSYDIKLLGVPFLSPILWLSIGIFAVHITIPIKYIIIKALKEVQE